MKYVSSELIPPFLDAKPDLLLDQAPEICQSHQRIRVENVPGLFFIFFLIIGEISKLWTDSDISDIVE